MRKANPPFIATWILEHLIPGDRNDALSGDLLEEFRSGRSASWYWQQVLAAMAIGFLREIRVRSLVVIFAALWTIPVRAWWLFAFWPAAHSAGFLFPWPYSTMLGAAILVFQSLWAGLIVYSLLYSLMVRNFNIERVGRGFWIAPLVFILLVVPGRILHRPLGIVASQDTIKVLAFFLSLVVAAWGVRSRVAPESKATAP
jgi:hypothetical protein